MISLPSNLSGFATLGKDVPDMNPFPWDSMMHVDAR